MSQQAEKKPMQRSLKGSHKPDTWVKPDGMDYALDCWKTWMHGDADRDLKAKPMGGLQGNTDGYGRDIWEEQLARDNAIGAATNTEINNLKPLHIWAIYKLCSMATSWRFPQADFITVGVEAKQHLEKNLKRNVCTSSLF